MRTLIIAGLLFFGLYGCKKQSDIPSKETILMKHTWCLSSSHKMEWDSSSAGKHLQTDTIYQAASCDQQSKYQFLKDSLLKIDLSCMGQSVKDGKWFLTSDNILTAVVPITYSNPSPSTYLFGINGSKLLEIDDGHFVVKDTTAWNYYSTNGNGQYSSSTVRTFRN